MSAVKSIYAAIAVLGLSEEEDRRDLYERVTGKRSLRAMAPSEKDAVLDELRRMGFRPTNRRQLSGPYAAKLQALWISGWNLGLVRSRDDAALVAFVKRQTGIEDTRFLRDPVAATKVVEALKSWLDRDGGVDWYDGRDQPSWLRDHSAKIALAQWRKLIPEGIAGDAFKAAVFEITGPKSSLQALSKGDWRAVTDTFGARVRTLSPALARKEA